MNVLHSLLTLILLVFSVYYIYKPLIVIIEKIKTGAPTPINHNAKKQFMTVFRMVFLQEKLRQDPIYGFLHFWFLYGFFVLSIGHIELVLYGLTIFLEDFVIGFFYDG